MHSTIVLQLFVTHDTHHSDSSYWRHNAGRTGLTKNHVTFPSSVFLSSCFNLALSLPSSLSCWPFLSLSAAFSHPSMCHHSLTLSLSSWLAEISALDTSQSTKSVCQMCQWSTGATWVAFWLPADFHFKLLIKTIPLFIFFPEHCQPVGIHFRSLNIFSMFRVTVICLWYNHNTSPCASYYRNYITIRALILSISQQKGPFSRLSRRLLTFQKAKFLNFMHLANTLCKERSHF